MKKIMFNDRYGLTEAVINGRKIETRRIELICKLVDGWIALGYSRIEVVKNGKVRFHDDKTGTYVEEKTRYAIDEVVAVAQSYADCGNMPDYDVDDDGYPIMPRRSGFFNKMFVRADLMPHRIRISDIRIERLQDITNEGCVFEGILQPVFSPNFQIIDHEKSIDLNFNTPREAFTSLIDKVSGRGTWESNPYVVVYEFELVK